MTDPVFEAERRRLANEEARRTQIPAASNLAPYFTTDQTDLDAVLNSPVAPSWPEPKESA